MQLSDATKLLTPRSLCIAVTAASASAGDLDRGYLPMLLELVSKPFSLPSYKALLDQLSPVALGVQDDDTSDSLSLDAESEDGQLSPGSVAHYVHSCVASIRTVDKLYDVAASFVPPESENDPLLHNLYDHDGPIACYLRVICAMFAALSFEQAADLVEGLISFVNGESREDTSVLTHGGASVVLEDGQARLKCRLDQDGREAAFSLASGVPLANDDLFQLLTKVCGKDTPILDFAMHLEAVRRRDHTTAFDLLHRYYDLSLAEIARASCKSTSIAVNDTAVSGDTGLIGDNVDPSRLDTRGHQYAALSLAALHFNLGHADNAKAALDDAVRAAQQCNDDACLAQALSWMARMSDSVEQRYQLMQHAKDSVALAREELQTVITPLAKLARVSVPPIPGESFWKHEHRHYAALSSARIHRIHSLVGLSCGDLRVESLLLSAAAWDSHAAVPTALTLARTALSIATRRRPRHRDHLSRTEAQATIAVARLEAKMGFAESAIKDLLQTARVPSNDMTINLHPQRSSSMPEQEILLRCAAWLKFERALRRCEFAVAQCYTNQIEVLASCSVVTDIVGGPDAELDAIEARCRLQLAMKDYIGAARHADILVRRAAALVRPIRVIEGFRYSAEVFIRAGSSISALPSILSGISLARGLGLEAAYVRCVLTLVDGMLRMEGNGSKEFAVSALESLNDVLPRANEGLGLCERGRANKLHAECLLANVDPPIQRDRANLVLGYLEIAINAHETMEDSIGQRDCWYLVARLHHSVGDLALRNAAAAKFQSLSDMISNARELREGYR